MREFIIFGTPVSNKSSLVEPMQNLYDACIIHPDFEVIDIRSYKDQCDTVVVDCCNGQVPNRNRIGIKNRERLALFYNHKSKDPYEVRALRKDFPITLHQNHLPDEQSASLCIYFEPWSVVERTWTPQLFLKRILWWLKETACGTLHRDDQPLEQLYFRSPIEFVLPVDFDEHIKNRDLKYSIQNIEKPKEGIVVIRGFFQKIENIDNQVTGFECIAISPPPVLHAPINKFPRTLGELHEQFVVRGSDIFNELNDGLKRGVSSKGIKSSSISTSTLLILSVDVKRDEESKPEKTEKKGFVIYNTTYTKLGEACGALLRGDDGKYYIDSLIGDKTVTRNTWKTLSIEPIEIIPSVTRPFARKSSGIEEDDSDFKGVLAGVGSLGSALADIWSKEAWGHWIYVDDDYIKPHNVIRHIARDSNIGMDKVHVVNLYTSSNYYSDNMKSNIIAEKANDFSISQVNSVLDNSSLFIDATTTLDVPRDIALKDSAPRAASVFLTPSGKSSVLLLEDKKRTIRLDSLEVQYYRALIEKAWGQNHLSGHKGHIWVGAGCRDVSMVISQELILLHAATLARQTRLALNQSKATIKVWESIGDTGAIDCHTIPVYPIRNCTIENWKVNWDERIYLKIIALRKQNLPCETGGIIVGYIDQKQKKINLVDILEAPIDSEASSKGFIRGSNGIIAKLDEIANKTANIVGYIGEWHSHPRRSSAFPSSLDFCLLQYLSRKLAEEGNPALMVIAGDHDLSICIGEKD